ncbi:hypothetical protein GCM10010306_091290 [Streptomyces umbrinus]|nr:hypothetical protein GCM10010306_091290 [Streptomyces umbrinus]
MPAPVAPAGGAVRTLRPATPSPALLIAAPTPAPPNVSPAAPGPVPPERHPLHPHLRDPEEAAHALDPSTLCAPTPRGRTGRPYVSLIHGGHAAFGTLDADRARIAFLDHFCQICGHPLDERCFLIVRPADIARGPLARTSTAPRVPALYCCNLSHAHPPSVRDF